MGRLCARRARQPGRDALWRQPEAWTAQLHPSFQLNWGIRACLVLVPPCMCSVQGLGPRDDSPVGSRAWPCGLQPPRPPCRSSPPHSTPGLERHVAQQRWSLPWQAVTLFDPLLQPLRRGFFRQTVRRLPPAGVPATPASCTSAARMRALRCGQRCRFLKEGGAPLWGSPCAEGRCLPGSAARHCLEPLPAAAASPCPPAGGGRLGLRSGGAAGCGVLPAGVPGGQGWRDERLHPLLCAA